MPTVGWIREKDEERFLEGQAPPARGPVKPRGFPCSSCGINLPSIEELRHHLRLEHPLGLPALYVQAQPLLQESVVRAPVAESDVRLFRCSSCRVQVDGSQWEDMAVSEFRKRFTRATNSTWRIRLVHERRVDHAQTTSDYFVRFRIPHASDLNEVDSHFIQTLVLDDLRHPDLERFESGLKDKDAPAREYGGALGEYALGIILKERRSYSHAPVGFAEFESKMRSALKILRDFHRPVALTVSSSIRFNLNDFHDYGTTTATELEAALRFFRKCANLPVKAEAVGGEMSTPPLQDGAPHPICPIDQVTCNLLSACGHLCDGDVLSLTHLNELRQLIRGGTMISTHDLAKVHVICSEGYLRLGRASDARPHLHAIQFDSVFKRWVQHRLEENTQYEA